MNTHDLGVSSLNVDKDLSVSLFLVTEIIEFFCWDSSAANLVDFAENFKVKIRLLNVDIIVKLVISY